MTRYFSCGLVALVLALAPVASRAQATSGAISGRVADDSGGLVPGATVTLERPGAAARSAQTDGNGAFRFEGIPAGAYTLRISLSGFAEDVRPVEVTAGQERKVEVTLRPAGLKEDVTVTATRTPQEIAAIPGSVTVIPRRVLIEQTLPKSGLGDTLGKMVPGMAGPQQSDSQAGQTLRGRVLSVLIDGVPQSTTRNVQRDLETIDPSAIERIEVLRGPTAIYGDGATGGVINIITRIPGAGKAQFTTDLDLGSSLTHPDGSVSGRVWQSASGKKDLFDYSLSGSFEHVGGFFDAEGDRVPPDPNNQGGLADSDNLAGFAKLGLDFSGQRFQLMVNHARRRQHTDFTTDPAVNTQAGHQKARTLAGLDIEEPQGADNTIVNLEYRRPHVLSSEVHAQAYYRDYASTFFPRDFRAVAARGNLVYQSFVESTKKGGRLEIATSFEGARRPVIVWGFDATLENTAQPVWVLDPAAYDQSRGLVFRITGRRSWTPPMDQRNLAGFAHLEWKPLDRVVLRGGVRHERIKVDVDDFTVLQGFAIPGGRLDYRATPANAGIVVSASQTLNAFFNFSQGFSIADIGLVLRAAPNGFTVNRLRPEAQVVNNYEVGMRLSRRAVSATISGFYNTSKFGVTFAPDFTMVRSPERIYGVETTLDASPDDKLRLGLTGTWLEGKFDPNRTGNYTAYLPDDRIPAPKVSFYVDHQTTPRWRNRVQAFYSAERDRFGAQGQPDLIGRIGFGLARIEPYFLVDVFSYLNVGRGTVRFAVQNALNRMYFPPVSQWSGQDSTYAAAQGAVFSVGYTIRY